MKQEKHRFATTRQRRLMAILGLPIRWYTTQHCATRMINNALVEMGLGGKIRGAKAPWRLKS